MYTRCPKCSTCFRVTDRHLAIAKGKVRCGQCKLVFNAPDNAIDDLPAKQNSAATNIKPDSPVKPTTKAEIKKPPTSVAETKITAAKATIAKTKTSKPASKIKPHSPKVETTSFEAAATMVADAESIVSKNKTVKSQEPIIEKPVTETTAANTPVKKTAQYDANATLIAETGILNKHNLDSIDLDASSEHQHSFGDNDDDLFDDSFDLDAAINELDQAATDEAHDIDVEDEPIPVEAKEDLSEDNSSGGVFTTDAYDATSAESVADILSEMEGQLSLDIPEPENNDKYDANDEFEFIQLDDEREALTTGNNTKSEEETNEETLKNHFDFNDVLDEIEELEDELKNDASENESIVEETVDAEELFDHLDISDFEESEIEEDIILDDSHSQNIGQHNADDENDIPFQLRKDLEGLQTTPQRRIHPLFKFTFIIILFALSFSQLAYFRAHELVNLIPSSQPLLEQFCEAVNCHYSGPRDTKKIQLISRDVRLHPKAKKALLISAAMINNAPFAQPYPDIHVRLSDISGNVVAERIFNAKTYMGKLSNPFLLMKSKTPVHINFEVVDPGRDAINFEFTFL